MSDSYNSFAELALAQGWDEARQHHELAESHYDLYKEVNGVRPRWIDYNAMSVADLIKEIEQLSAESAAQCARDEWDAAEDQWLAECHALEIQGCLEADIQAMLANGAPDTDTAIRWAQQAHH